MPGQGCWYAKDKICGTHNQEQRRAEDSKLQLTRGPQHFTVSSSTKALMQKNYIEAQEAATQLITYGIKT